MMRLTMLTVVAGLMFAMAAPEASGQETASAPAPVIHTADNAPATPKLEDLPLRESVGQYGITWTFDKPAPVGRFVNGDWYVVGEVTVKAIDPAPVYGKDVPQEQLDATEKRRIEEADRLRNGSMVNPPPKAEVAFDSGVKNWYRPALSAKLPITLKPGDSLLSSISLELNERPKFPFHSQGPRAAGDNCPLRVLAVLTCVPSPQPADAFRPSYADRQQKIYLARDLKRALLPKLPRVEGEPARWESGLSNVKVSGPEGAPDPVAFARVFQKCWFDTCLFGFERPMENMPHYGRWVGQAPGDAGLLLCMDFTPEQKEPLLVNLVQVGIDYWGLVRAGHRGWEGWGGHGSGRKFPIVFAGMLLGDDVMAAPGKAFPKTEFGEDNQTAYGDCWTGAKVVFTGHSGISTATGTPPRPQWGPYEHLRPDQWSNDGSIGRKNWQSEGYRRCCTSNCWVGQALTMRLLKGEKNWGHDAFFDYVDRWMTEDDAEHRKELDRNNPPKGYEKMPKDDNKEAHQGFASEEWVATAWKKYRTMPGMPPTDGWKQQHDDSYYRAAVEKMPNRPTTQP